MANLTERQYDLIHNEGGEGYNPIRERRVQAEHEAARASRTPRTRSWRCTIYRSTMPATAQICTLSSASNPCRAASADRSRLNYYQNRASELQANYGNAVGRGMEGLSSPRRAIWSAGL